MRGFDHAIRSCECNTIRTCMGLHYLARVRHARIAIGMQANVRERESACCISSVGFHRRVEKACKGNSGPVGPERLQQSSAFIWESTTGRHACGLGFTMLAHSAFGSASNSTLHEALGTGPSLKWEHVLSRGQENPTDRPAGSSPSALAIAQLLGCFFQGTIRRPRERQTQVSRKRCTHPLKQVWKGGVHVECVAHMTLSPAKRTF